jgi:hypothetical protein
MGECCSDKIRQLFVGIDSSGFKATHASQYYSDRVKPRKYIKLSLAAAVLQQIICTIEIRRAHARRDKYSVSYNVDIFV